MACSGSQETTFTLPLVGEVRKEPSLRVSGSVTKFSEHHNFPQCSLGIDTVSNHKKSWELWWAVLRFQIEGFPEKGLFQSRKDFMFLKCQE